MSKCPGQDTAYWKPEDVYDLECQKCQNKVEFFKTDKFVRCSCGELVFNEKLDLGCALWCSAASTCIGLDYPLKKYKNEDEKKKDLEKLLGIADESERKKIKELYEGNNSGSLLNVKGLYILKLQERNLYNQIINYLRQIVEEKN